mmetsp:Transcript_9872/g.9556  ORF Transcript_9872/g.9556 Transcript_9872/m.9556 type:complete len:159 (-) Transcript_9872:298-774(-)|eukprot:CAMPEP_0197822964 /NCGR_PEP_ID=MMETSP1437-20131217/281_1 /TAXON_ID=49252 ORGANISM="Eucampia antarctica, Strain CCMP1452" /NCGR_SAMPLE_ID=MMETSP1437 /ASSEMBLY_ACC=CAM_ASM_001096 /LENGTH=158 /DNA_ID=CAMNT_0043421877 /DNA_START=112 /DNA_END=588 /DNA_ORIENTATION=-
MKSSINLALVSMILASMVQCSVGFGSFTGAKLDAVQNSASMTMEYIPSGMSKAQWAKVKAAEKSKNKGKNLGKSGITTFSSQSFAEWQKKGSRNLFPVDPNDVKDKSELPYMQRPGGKADGSDLKKKGGFSGFNLFGGKKKAEPVEEPEEKKTNFWTF